jgi:Uma2 family endonuclease
MITSATALQLITPAEYLEGEERAELRHEYIQGRVYAMSGASDRHNEIALDVASLLKAHLKGGSCKTYLLDMKVEVPMDHGVCYYYPDVFVTCTPEDAESPLIKRSPVLVTEVLSPSTWRVDEGEKLRNYARIPSVSEVLLIAQNWPEVILHRRASHWRAESFTQVNDVIRLQSIGMDLSLQDIYASVSFTASDSRPWYLAKPISE